MCSTRKFLKIFDYLTLFLGFLADIGYVAGNFLKILPLLIFKLPGKIFMCSTKLFSSWNLSNLSFLAGAEHS